MEAYTYLGGICNTTIFMITIPWHDLGHRAYISGNALLTVLQLLHIMPRYCNHKYCGVTNTT